MNAVVLSLALAYAGKVEAFLSERQNGCAGNFTVDQSLTTASAHFPILSAITSFDPFWSLDDFDGEPSPSKELSIHFLSSVVAPLPQKLDIKTHFNEVGDFFKKQLTVAADYVSEASLQQCQQEVAAQRDATYEQQRLFNIEQAVRSTESKPQHHGAEQSKDANVTAPFTGKPAERAQEATVTTATATAIERGEVNSSTGGALASHLLPPLVPWFNRHRIGQQLHSMLHSDTNTNTNTGSGCSGNNDSSHCYRMHSSACQRALVINQLAEQLKEWLSPMRGDNDHKHISSAGGNVSNTIATKRRSLSRVGVQQHTSSNTSEPLHDFVPVTPSAAPIVLHVNHQTDELAAPATAPAPAPALALGDGSPLSHSLSQFHARHGQQLREAAEAVRLAATAPRPQSEELHLSVNAEDVDDLNVTIALSGELEDSEWEDMNEAQTSTQFSYFSANISSIACIMASISFVLLSFTLAVVVPDLVIGRPAQQRLLDLALQEVRGYPNLSRVFVLPGTEAVADESSEECDQRALEHMRKIVRVISLEIFAVLGSITVAMLFDDSNSVWRFVFGFLFVAVGRVLHLAMMSFIPPAVLFMTVLAAQWTGIAMVQTNMWKPSGSIGCKAPPETGAEGADLVAQAEAEADAVPLAVRKHLSPINEDDEEDWETLEHEDAMEEQEQVQEVQQK